MGKYDNKHFLVNNWEESRKLQQILIDDGYKGVNDAPFEYTKQYPHFINTDEDGINWSTGYGEDYYLDNGSVLIPLPWKSKQEALSDKVTAITQEVIQNATPQWTDKHYNFNVDVSDKDTLKVDPYFVSKTWKIGSKDESGALFHILKTISRFGSKNTREREIKAIYKQIVRLAELEGVELEEK